jgi:hypothetical protein
MPPNGGSLGSWIRVRTTLKATAREVDSFAGRATGSGTSTAAKAKAKAVTAARQVAPHPRQATKHGPPPGQRGLCPGRQRGRSRGHQRGPSRGH